MTFERFAREVTDMRSKLTRVMLTVACVVYGGWIAAPVLAKSAELKNQQSDQQKTQQTNPLSALTVAQTTRDASDAKSAGSVPGHAMAPAQVALVTKYPVPLYDDIRISAAHWPARVEVRFVRRVADKLRMTDAKGDLGIFLAPETSLKRYYFTIIKDESSKRTVFVVNRHVFFSTRSFRAYIHNEPDWELIGYTLGVYSGPLTVPVGP